MKKTKINTFYFLFFFMFQILSYSQFDSRLIGSLFINSLLIEKDFSKSYSYFEESIKDKISTDMLKETSEKLEAQLGKFKSIIEINNEKENYTRFFVISDKDIIIEGSGKISIITSTGNKSGALMELLQILSKYNLNMVNLKSRPRANKPWEYYFYIDFEGNLKDEKVIKALEEIREKSNYLQILGNYKIYNLKI